jgi:hypothetical protein
VFTVTVSGVMLLLLPEFEPETSHTRNRKLRWFKRHCKYPVTSVVTDTVIKSKIICFEKPGGESPLGFLYEGGRMVLIMILQIVWKVVNWINLA